jgi:hypothetical protein
MLMALENGELAAEVVGRFLSSSQTDEQFANIAEVYRKLYGERFNARLRVCSWLRRAAFVPGLADAAIRVAGANERLRRKLAMATRGDAREPAPNRRHRELTRSPERRPPAAQV